MKSSILKYSKAKIDQAGELLKKKNLSAKEANIIDYKNINLVP